MRVGTMEDGALHFYSVCVPGPKGVLILKKNAFTMEDCALASVSYTHLTLPTICSV